MQRRRRPASRALPTTLTIQLITVDHRRRWSVLRAVVVLSEQSTRSRRIGIHYTSLSSHLLSGADHVGGTVYVGGLDSVDLRCSSDGLDLARVCSPRRRKADRAMGQAKSKVECPLCGGRSDTDDGCDTPSVDEAASPEKESKHFDADRPLLTPLLAPEDDGGGGRGHPSTASLPAYVGTGPLSSVAEEPGLAGDPGGDGTLAENHTTSLRHQLIVLRGNRHHPPGHRVRSVDALTLHEATVPFQFAEFQFPNLKPNANPNSNTKPRVTYGTVEFSELKGHRKRQWRNTNIGRHEY